MMNNPWQDITPGCYRRQDIDTNVFFAKEITGAYLFIIDLEELLSKDIEISLKGIDIKTSIKEETSVLTLILKNDNNWEIFYKLCEDLMCSAKSVKTNRTKTIMSRLMRWQTILKNENHNVPEELQIGLMGELIFLNEYLSTVIPLKQAIDSWVGPEKEKQDFRVNGVCVEVKSFMDRKQDQINISSIEQLSTYSESLYLFVIGFKSLDIGETLEDYCKKIYNRIYEECPEMLSSFEDLLISYGYYYQCKYDNLKRLTTYKINCYSVLNNFPRIPISVKKQAILNVNYKLDLSFCKEFQVEFEKVCNAIRGNI